MYKYIVSVLDEGEKILNDQYQANNDVSLLRPNVTTSLSKFELNSKLPEVEKNETKGYIICHGLNLNAFQEYYPKCVSALDLLIYSGKFYVILVLHTNRLPKVRRDIRK